MRRAHDAFGQAGEDAVYAKANKKEKQGVKVRQKTDTKGKYVKAREVKASKQVACACGGAGVGG